MSRLKHIVIMAALLATGAQAQVGDDMPWSIVPDSQSEQPAVAPPPMMQVIADRSPLGLPDERPRLSMTMPLSNRRSAVADDSGEGSAFSWSLKAWQMNTASLAHIQCSQGMMTMNSYLAQDCRFVDGPAPSDSVNLLQVSGDWMAAPGLQLGISAFRGDEAPATRAEQPFAFDLDPELLARGRSNDVTDGTVEGLDVNVSFGIQTERIGDFLVGLQLARYRQRMSLSDLGMPLEPLQPDNDMHYSNSAQVLLGWRRGAFSGEMLGHHRELPLWMGAEAPTTLNSFDLEFSWHAQRNASLSVGVSNVMDAAPRADEASSDAALEDPLESVYGRIPYVRYKQDL